MIVIPPSNDKTQDEYFNEVAKNAWEKSDSQYRNSLKSENKTLVMQCKLTIKDTYVIINLHYRYYNDTLYCFVEETETPPEKIECQGAH